jgi:hypothetical protein
MVTDPKSTPQPGEERGCLVIEWESSSSPLEVSLEVTLVAARENTFALLLFCLPCLANKNWKEMPAVILL